MVTDSNANYRYRLFIKSAMNRKEFVRNTGLGLLAGALPLGAGATKSNGLKHSLCRWCFPDFTLEELCVLAKELGIQSIELLDPEETAITKKYGLQCLATPKAGGLGTLSWDRFLNSPAEHDRIVLFYEDLIKRAANAGILYVVLFSGKRGTSSDYEALLHCKTVIQRMLKTAEKYKVTLAFEMLNSKEKGLENYQGDRTEWAVVLCEMVASSWFKLIYDVYHMQVMEGNVIATIQKYHSYFCHYHVAGVPGRHDLHLSQELNYKSVVDAIVQTGYKGYIGYEFLPLGKTKAEQKEAIREAMKICSTG